jgi:hypothetical protein
MNEQQIRDEFSGSHPYAVNVLRWFAYDHLPEYLKGFSQQCYDLAANMCHDLPDSGELINGLRKLLEAKDSFVRAAQAARP